MRDKMSVRKGAMTASAAALLWALLSTGTALADEPVEFDLDPAPLGDSLRAFGQQSGVAIMFSEAAVAPLTAPSVKGIYEPEAALAVLLQGSGLEFVSGPDQTFIVRPSTATNAGQEPEVRSGIGNPDKDISPPRDDPPEQVNDANKVDKHQDDEAALRQEQVTITGSLIRGVAPESSPLNIYTREQILQSGAASTEQFIRTLPQNFSGGSTELARGGLPGDANSQRNNVFGTGANLRGLGSGATLTLLNGRRLAPTSAIGDFVDLSLIPLSALEHIDVLTDGASSIYGGDAVAGVVNFILRDDFNGAETGIQYGAATEGNHDTFRFSQAVGNTWANGNIFGAYEYSNRSELSLADRPDLAPPTLTGGGAIGDTRPFDLLPQQTRNSVVLSGRQSVGAKIEISGNVLYAEKEVVNSGVASTIARDVSRTRVQSESATGNLGIDYEISARWSASLEMGYSQLENEREFQVLEPDLGDRVPSETQSTIWSAGLLINGEIINLPGGNLKASVGTQFRSEQFNGGTPGEERTRDGERDVTAIYGEVHIPLIGQSNKIALVDRLEVNVSGRIDDYSDFGTTSNPKFGILWVPVNGLSLRSSWSTSFAPPALGLAGARDRTVIVIPYDFARTVLNIELPDPSLAGVNYILSNGTDGNLQPETSETLTLGFDFDLETGPQKWSISSTYYDIQFEGRLGTTPIPGNINFNLVPGLAFNDPTLFPADTVIFFPTEQQINSVVSAASQPVLFAGGATAIENIGFINRVNMTRNLASTNTRGLDLEIEYETETALGRLTAGLNTNYIFEFSNQGAVTTPEIEILNTLYNPVDLQLRAHLGVIRGGFSGAVFVNYVDSYHTDSTSVALPIDSWTTADLSVSYNFDLKRRDWLSGTRIGFSAINLFDQSPPQVPPLSAFGLPGYDPANATPVGRMLSLELHKRF